ncbi:uncharacterized protein LOC144882691 [Branchiostoma floridae x Branchiostoma japonicum]
MRCLPPTQHDSLSSLVSNFFIFCIVSRTPPDAGRVFVLCFNLTSRTMPGGQQQSQTGDTGTTPMQQPQTDWRARADAAANIPNPMYVSRADYTHSDAGSGQHTPFSFIRSHQSYMTAGIAVLLSLVAVGLAPLTFINKEEIYGLSTAFDTFKRDQDNMSTIVDDIGATVDALKRDQDDIRQLSTTVDALKREQDDIRKLSTVVDALKRDEDDIRQLSTTVDALKREQHNISTTVDALKRNQDDMRQLSTTVDALKREQDDIRKLSTTVDVLKRDQDNMRQLSTTVDALKRDQDDLRQLFTTVDALKRDLDKVRSRTATLEQPFRETSKAPGKLDYVVT